MTDTTFFQTVYHHPLLRDNDYKVIGEAHTKIDLAPGTPLLEAGKTAREFYVIEEGLCRSFLYDYNGNEITIEYYCPGEILIESFSLFQRIPSNENFQAVSAVTAWKISYDAFQQLLQTVEGFREWGRNWATHQLFVLKQRSIQAFTISATDRYLQLIATRPAIIALSPLKHVASYLGITDSSLSRIRKEIAAG